MPAVRWRIVENTRHQPGVSFTPNGGRGRGGLCRVLAASPTGGSTGESTSRCITVLSVAPSHGGNSRISQVGGDSKHRTCVSRGTVPRDAGKRRRGRGKVPSDSPPATGSSWAARAVREGWRPATAVGRYYPKVGSRYW